MEKCIAVSMPPRSAYIAAACNLAPELALEVVELAEENRRLQAQINRTESRHDSALQLYDKYHDENSDLRRLLEAAVMRAERAEASCLTYVRMLANIKAQLDSADGDILTLTDLCDAYLDENIEMAQRLEAVAEAAEALFKADAWAGTPMDNLRNALRAVEYEGVQGG